MVRRRGKSNELNTVSQESRWKTPLPIDETLQQANWIIRLRWMAIGSTFAAAGILRLIFPYSFLPVIVITACAFGYNLAAWLHIERYTQRGPTFGENELQVNLQLQIILDILVLGWAVHLTGGVQSEIIPIYLIHLPLLGLAVPRRTILLQSTLAAGVLAFIFALEYFGILPHGDLGTTPDPSLHTNFQFVVRRWVTLTLFLYLGAYMTDYLAGRFRRLLTAENRARRQAETLRRIAASLASTLEWDETLEVVLDSIGELIPWDSVVVLLVNGDEAEIAAGRGIPDEIPNVNLWPHYYTLLEHQKSIIFANTDDENYFWNIIGLQDVKTSICAPMMPRGSAPGLLIVGSHTPSVYKEEDASLVQSLAHYAALAVENSRLYESVRQQALTDGLTGLYNVRHLYIELEQELLRCDRYKNKLSMLMCDLDNFKQYNDRYGHLAGDDLLRELAALMTRITRRSDKVFRYGGEEFAVLLVEADLSLAMGSAERLRQAVQDHDFLVSGNKHVGRITISIGVASYPKNASSVKALINAADMALLEAKKYKNQVCAASI